MIEAASCCADACVTQPDSRQVNSPEPNVQSPAAQALIPNRSLMIEAVISAVMFCSIRD